MNNTSAKRKHEDNTSDSEDEQVCEKIKKIRIARTTGELRLAIDIKGISAECKKSCIDLTFVNNNPLMLEITYSTYDPPYTFIYSIQPHYPCQKPTVYYNNSIVKLSVIEDWRPVFGLGDIIQELSKCIYYNTLILLSNETTHPLNNSLSFTSMEEE